MTEFSNEKYREYIEHGQQFLSNNGSLAIQNLGILDLDYLDEFIGLVGKEVIENGIELFFNSSKDYLSNVKSGLVTNDLRLSSSEAHKLKGAANSIGLKQVGLCAKEIQLMIDEYDKNKMELSKNLDKNNELLIDAKEKISNEIKTLEELIDISLQILNKYIC